MIEISRTVAVSSSPAEVWAVLSQFAAISAWAPNVDHSRLLTDQEEGEGMVRRIQTGRITVTERVVDWKPHEVLAYAIEGLPPIVRSVTNRWTIEPAAAGASVTLATTIEPGPRPPHRLAAKALGRRLAQASDQMLGGLKAFLAGAAWSDRP